MAEIWFFLALWAGHKNAPIKFSFATEAACQHARNAYIVSVQESTFGSKEWTQKFASTCLKDR